MITNTQLRAVMQYHLGSFNDENVEITDDTVHNTVLSATDGDGAANSMNIYQLAIILTLKKAGHAPVVWPTNWMTLTVAQLSNILVP